MWDFYAFSCGGWHNLGDGNRWRTRAIVAWIVFATISGCASSPQRISPDQMTEIEEAITDRLFSAMHDRMDCEIVDRIESAGPGHPQWAIFEDGEGVAMDDLPPFVRESVREGRALCVEQVPEIADLWEPARLFDCIEQGHDVDQCMTEEG